jgi:hydrogenase expression/formation protein HypE
MDIIMIGYAGASGTEKIVRKKYDELKEKYPEWFLTKACEINHSYDISGYPDKISDRNQKDRIRNILDGIILTTVKDDENVPLFLKCGEGGIMNTLWELGLIRKKGFVIDILSIPIRQETVEISECYHLDPYRLESYGTYIAVVRSSAEAISLLEKEGIEADTIGYLNNTRDKILLFDTDKEVRFLDRPRADELGKVIDKTD